MSELPLVSVIMPVYNAAKTLSYCLDTVFALNYPNLELIFVNDCSSDSGVQIITDYIDGNRHRQNIHAKLFHHLQNRGVAAARNTGLEHAEGDYIYYIDSDDKVEPDALIVMMTEMLKQQAEIVGCEWYLTYRQNARYMKQPAVGSPEEAFYKMTGGLLRWNLWLFLVKRSLYETHHIRFLEGMNMGEDLMVMGKLLLHARTIVMVHQPLYHYLQTNAASLTKATSDTYIHQVRENVRELESYATRTFSGKVLSESFSFLKLNIKLPLLTSGKKEDYIIWLQWFPEADDAIMRNRLLPLRTRLLQWFAHRKQYWLVRLYYMAVFRVIYGVIYR